MTPEGQRMPDLRPGPLFVAAMLILGLAGCGTGATPSGPDASPSAPVGQATSEQLDAEDLLAEPPDGLTYVDAAPELEQEMRSRLDRSGASKIIDSLAVRAVESGSIPVGAVVAMVLNDQATSADKQGILRGIEEGAGTEGQSVEVAGAPATYIEDGQARMLLHVGEDVVFMVFGQARSDIEPILAALVDASPSES